MRMSGVRWRQSSLPVCMFQPFVCEYESIWQNEHQTAISVATGDQMQAVDALTDRRETNESHRIGSIVSKLQSSSY